MKKYMIVIALVSIISGNDSQAQNSLAEKLGYPKNTRLLIIHADDAGVSHSQDSATISAWNKGAVTSTSIMVPCPWFSEIAGFAKQHPEFDWGIHLTLTSEWKNYRWGSVSPSSGVPSLLTKEGYFPSSVEELSSMVKPAEAEIELRAQILKAKAAGIRLTHLDTHMGSIMASAELIGVYEKLGKEFGLPVLMPRSAIKAAGPVYGKYIDTTQLSILDNLSIASPGIPNDKWKDFYDSTIHSLPPGLSELIVHLAFDDGESRAISIEHADYGAAWRQRDYDYITSDPTKALLKKENIVLVSWGQIQKVIYPAKQ